MESIVNTFDTWITAQGLKSKGRLRSVENISQEGINRIRELILDLAIKGVISTRATTHLQNTLPAELTDKQLSKDDSACLFSIPANWIWVKLGDIAEIERGGSPRPIQSYLTNDPDGFNWIKIGDTDIGGKYISSAKEKITSEGLSKTRKVYAGDFLLTNSMSFGRPYITKIDGCIHDGWLRIHPPSWINKDYLYYLLSSHFVALFFRKKAAGAVVQNLNTEKVRDLPIPIPPIEEQQSIVQAVDKLMAVCDELEYAETNHLKTHETLVQVLLDGLTAAQDAEEFEQAWQRVEQNFDVLFTTEDSIDQLKQTTLQLAVMGKLVEQDPNDEPASELLKKINSEKTKSKKDKEQLPIKPDEVPFNIPNNWVWCRLSKISEVGTGATPLTTNSEYYGGNIPWITSSATNSLFVYEAETFITAKAVQETNCQIYPIGTLIVAMYGQGKTRGQITELTIDAATNQACAAIMLINRQQEHREYIKYFFQKIYNEIRELAEGGAQPNLNLQKIKDTILPLPPLREQRRIVARANELFALCDKLREKIIKSNMVKNQMAASVLEQID